MSDYPSDAMELVADDIQSVLDTVRMPEMYEARCRLAVAALRRWARANPAPQEPAGCTPGGRSPRTETAEGRRHYTHDTDPSCHYCVRDGLVSVPTSADKPPREWRDILVKHDEPCCPRNPSPPKP